MTSHNADTPDNPALTHTDAAGTARMVDVGDKAPSKRLAIARGRVVMAPATLALIAENGLAKGDVLATARLAGIMGAKQTANLIPLCHPLGLDHIQLDFTLNRAENAVEIEASASLTGKTGVEMEALTAVSVAALTLYDMCKAADKKMQITDIRLTHKSGGKSGAVDYE